MSRKKILEDTLARLEVERFAPLPQRQPRDQGPPPDLTPDQQADNRRILINAVKDHDKEQS